MASKTRPDFSNVTFLVEGSPTRAILPRHKYLIMLDRARAAGWEPQKPTKSTGELNKDFMLYLPPAKLDKTDADYFFEVLGHVCSTIGDSDIGKACAQLLTAKEFRGGFEVRAT